MTIEQFVPRSRLREDELLSLFFDLKGEHISKEPEDNDPHQAMVGYSNIDCCDVPSGDCNAGACV